LAINPLQVLNGSAEGRVFVGGLLHGFDLLAGRIRDDHQRDFRRLGHLSTDVEPTVGVDTKTGQKSVDSAHGLRGFEVLGVDEGGEAVRLESEGGGSMCSS